MRSREVIGMNWVISLTIVFSLLTLLHVFYNMSRFPLDISGKLWGYTPNVYLFLIVPFPLAAFTAFLGFSVLLKKLKLSSPRDPILQWMVSNWLVVVLIGIILVSVITISDYFYATKLPDLKQEFAVKALESADILRGQSESEKKESKQGLEQLKKERIKTLEKGKPPSVEQILSLEPSIYMKLILNSDIQRKWGLLDSTSLALSLLQLFAVLVTAYIVLLSILMIYLGIQDGYEVAGITDILKFSVVAFSAYPIFNRYFIAELGQFTDSFSTIGGDVLALTLISVAALLILTIDPTKRDFLTIVIRGLPFLFVIVPSIYIVFRGPLSLRNIIGIDANPGLRISFSIVMLLLAAIVVVVTWPRGNSTNP